MPPARSLPLPDDVLDAIVRRLSLRDQLRASLACKALGDAVARVDALGSFHALARSRMLEELRELRRLEGVYATSGSIALQRAVRDSAIASFDGHDHGGDFEDKNEIIVLTRFFRGWFYDHEGWGQPYPSGDVRLRGIESLHSALFLDQKGVIAGRPLYQLELHETFGAFPRDDILDSFESVDEAWMPLEQWESEDAMSDWLTDEVMYANAKVVLADHYNPDEDYEWEWASDAESGGRLATEIINGMSESETRFSNDELYPVMRATVWALADFARGHV